MPMYAYEMYGGWIWYLDALNPGKNFGGLSNWWIILKPMQGLISRIFFIGHGGIVMEDKEVASFIQK